MMRENDNFLGIVVTTVVALVIISLLIFWSLGWSVFGLKVWLPWATNQRTEVMRNTNQYVEAQQQKIYGLVRQHDQLDLYEQTEEIDRQQGNLIEQMCEAAGKIDDQYVPEQAQPLMRQEGCWS